tara:strand:- start:227 stop:487 length:261 start_codon:yes stop_codon:yes gene_type:complete
MAYLGKFVPWADQLTIIAAEYSISHRPAKLDWDTAAEFNGKIRDASLRIHFVGCDKGFGGANVEAGVAAAAMIRRSLVDRQGQISE